MNNGQKYGILGGYMSKNARTVKPEDKMRPDEINELIRLGLKALAMLRAEGAIELDVEQANHVTLYTKAGEGDWVYIMTDCGVGPMIRITWREVLAQESRKYKTLLKKRITENEKPYLTDEEADRYRVIRNLVKAFESVTDLEVL